MHRKPGLMEFKISDQHNHLVKTTYHAENDPNAKIKGASRTIIKGDFGSFSMEVLQGQSFIIGWLNAAITTAIDILPHTDTPILCWYTTLRGNVPCTLSGKGLVPLTELYQGLYYVPANGTNVASFPVGKYEAVYISVSTGFFESFFQRNPQFREIYERKYKRSEEGAVLPYFELSMNAASVLEQIFTHQETGDDLESFLDLNIRKLFYYYFKKLGQPGNIDRISEIKKEIDDNIGENIKINTLAQRIAFKDRGRLSSEFKVKFGVDIKTYIGRQILHLAEHALIHEKSRKIADIASDLGFTGQAYFTTFFKKWNGVTPSEFKKQSKENDMI